MDTNVGDKKQSGFPIKPGSYSAGFVKVLLIALIPGTFLWLINSPPAAAQDAGEYFQIDYSSANLSQNEVNGNGVFYAAISGKVTCTRDLPISVSEAIITSRVVAKDTVKGTVMTLNPGYTMTIKPFPSKTGEVGEMKQSVPLRFPATTESGDYSVIAELIEAKVKASFVWAEVTEYLPQSQLIGSVKYVSPEISQAPSPPPAVPPSMPEPEPVLPPAPALPPETVPSPALRAPGFAWWMWLVVTIALATTVVNIYFILRYRATRRTR